MWSCSRAGYWAYWRRHRGRDWCRAPAEELMRRARLAKAAGRYEAEVRLIRRAAEKHFWHAQFALGTMYLAGRREAGVAKHPARALEWLSAAARQGHKLAQYRVGVMHEAGLGGLAKDEAKALGWFSNVVAQSSGQLTHIARLPIARMHRRGEGGGGGWWGALYLDNPWNRSKHNDIL